MIRLTVVIPQSEQAGGDAWFGSNIQRGVESFFVGNLTDGTREYCWLSGQFTDTQAEAIQAQFTNVYEDTQTDAVMADMGLSYVEEQ